MQKIFGFNLIELMITLVIIGIVSAIAIPLYSQHMIHARRLQAEIQLIKLANALEQYYLLNNTYQDATLAKLGLTEDIANHQYTLHILSATMSDYLLKAIPLDRQAEQDVSCASLMLDSTGNKTISGSGTLTECWQ